MKKGKLDVESRFTKESDFCEHPEYWHSTDNSSTELEISFLIYSLVKSIQPEVCIESGTAYGQTTKLIGKALKENGHGVLYSFEINEDRIEYSSNLCKNLPVEIINKSTLDYIPNGKIDFMFFDGDINNRALEYNKFKEFFTDKTVLIFHDTAPHQPQYMKEFENELNIVRLHSPRGISICQIKQNVTD